MKPDKTIADAGEVGRAVERALQDARPGLGELELKEAILILETGTVTGAGLEINFVIFTFSRKESKGQTFSTILKFGSIKPESLKAASPEQFREPLTRAIATAADVARQIKVLPFAEATITIGFVVEKSADAQGKISFKILGIDLAGSKVKKNTSLNSLQVKFAPRTAQKRKGQAPPLLSR